MVRGLGLGVRVVLYPHAGAAGVLVLLLQGDHALVPGEGVVVGQVGRHRRVVAVGQHTLQVRRVVTAELGSWQKLL